MALAVESLPRKFEIKIGGNTIVLDDPFPNLGPEEVKDMLLQQYPELASSKVEGPRLTADAQVFTMSAGKVGVKG
ncbi:PRTRC system protein C [Pseudodesulfovibrio pelocollis]|uniref:PRTRC system protein C n=1 Tax=Pseudodesulfovibrio pelocollis TaxID=3051432 RepID=UPI00255A947E|nr:PRTRC system protein C [Pseudodesulfovibrio sp. SB368]